MRALGLLLASALAACAADTADLDTPDLDGGGLASHDAAPAELDAATLTSSVVIIDEPSLYQFYQVVDGHTVHMPLAVTGCAYPFPFPARVQNTGDTPLEGTLEIEGSEAFEVVGGALHLEPGQAAALEVRLRGEPVGRADGELVARYRNAGDSGSAEVTARRRLTGAVEQGPQVETYVIEGPPEINILYVVDGSPATERHRDAIMRAVDETHRAAQGVVWASWAVAYGAPGRPLVVGRGLQRVLRHPRDPRLIRDRVDEALTSTRTGDPLGAAVQALGELRSFDLLPWVVTIFSAVDGLPGDLAELDRRARHVELQVGGSSVCDAPRTPVLTAAAAALGATPRPICEPPWRLESTPGGPVRRSFPAHIPDPDTLRVEVDGVELPQLAADGRTNWSWDRRRNMIEYSSDAAPVFGNTVTLRYLRPCADITRFQRR